MEALGCAGSARLISVPGGPDTGIDSTCKKNIRASVGFRKEPFFRRKSSLTSGVSSWDYFKERDHLDYYCNNSDGRRRRGRFGNKMMTVSCGKGGDCKVAEKKEKEEKNKEKQQRKMMMKMEKRLKKMVQKQIVQGGDDLSETADPINPFADESKVSMMISDAAEKLLQQLQQLRAEEMSSESSSSSSESSDSDSDCGAGVVTDMRKQKNCSTSVDMEPVKTVEATYLPNGTLMKLPASLPAETAALISDPILADECTTVLEHNLEKQGEFIMKSSPVAATAGFLPASTKKVEVCMGGKCKKSGSMALLEELQRVLGTNEYAAVSGCKCMGKCRDGPNVRISDDLHTNALCIGVGLTDVDAIVENYIAANPEFGLNYA